MKRLIVKTDARTFDRYTEIGLWRYEGNVKFHVNFAGIVEGEAKAKGRGFVYIPVTFIIEDYFYSRELVDQRLQRS